MSLQKERWVIVITYCLLIYPFHIRDKCWSSPSDPVSVSWPRFRNSRHGLLTPVYTTSRPKSNVSSSFYWKHTQNFLVVDRPSLRKVSLFFWYRRFCAQELSCPGKPLVVCVTTDQTFTRSVKRKDTMKLCLGRVFSDKVGVHKIMNS